MSKDLQNLVEEAQRDISAAKAELRGRADQIAADYEERLMQLTNLAKALESGELTARVVQDRVRQLLGERGGFARAQRAGRTQIGMRAPMPPTPSGASVRPGPTPSLAAAAIAKARDQVDGLVVRALVAHDLRREEARLELALLAHLRRGLDLMAADMPEDTVLLEGVMEFTDLVVAVIADLAAGGVGRLKRLLDFLRELAGQLHAAGAPAGDAKEVVRRVRASLDASEPDVKRAFDEIVGITVKLLAESERRLPVKERTLFDDLLKTG